MTSCKACGMPIQFRKGPNGRPIPLQRVRTLYRVLPDGQVTPIVPTLPGGDPVAVFVSHFETCPNANDFSGKSRKGETDAESTGA